MSHPLHPALVHFPVACWSLATAGDLASLFWREPAWRFSGVLMAIGTVTAVAAMAAGFFELRKIDANAPAMRDANRHMLLAMAAWFCYAASLFLRLRGLTLASPGALETGFSAGGFIILCAVGWLGGKLVYGHGVGMRRHPLP
jgi:uncharacterized membrane protein